MSQRPVGSSRIHDGEGYEDQSGGYSLTEDMGRLGLSTKVKGPSSPSPWDSPEPPFISTQQRCQELPGLDEVVLNNCEVRSDKSLGSEIRAPLRESRANAAIRSHKNNMMRSETSQTQWHRGGVGHVDSSPELVNSVFGGVSKEVRGKRFALLMMGDSGRWRVVHSERPAKTFPGNEK